ncbi:MAG: DUF29 domain-containing protein [Acetobacteraceae bacterium]|nr:DUF29 domain-containing protein [Acetobacteraceae bacterium]MBV8522858.1 DUF29 domain-containing protein [Acetobacteraceae bacterium]MBV8590174.1 DUF29 domain-containing protein [Acetobacteraceae bacterium]
MSPIVFSWAEWSIIQALSEYDSDIVLWSKHHSEQLRRIAAGERVNDQVDWGSVIEEIESVGRSERRACGGWLRQPLAHLLRIQAWPNFQAVQGWQMEVTRHRQEPADAFAPSVRGRIDLERLYREARRLLPELIDGQLPDKCPVTLDELLSEDRCWVSEEANAGVLGTLA